MAAQRNIAYLTPFPYDQAMSPVVEAQSSLINLDTLLTVISEAAEDAEDRARESGNLIAGDLQRIKQMLWIAMEEQQRCATAINRECDVLQSHVDTRRAA